jgi:hypothetical protein
MSAGANVFAPGEALDIGPLGIAAGPGIVFEEGGVRAVLRAHRGIRDMQDVLILEVLEIKMKALVGRDPDQESDSAR